MRTASAVLRSFPRPRAPRLESTSAPARVILTWIWPRRSVGRYLHELEARKPAKSLKIIVSSSIAASSVIAE
eukprot:2399885-Pleurochrysis_carterae.AAC.1